MKKLFLGALALFIGAIGFAQNVVDLDQSGGSAFWMTHLINNANVQQVGSAITATIDQTAGTYNVVSSGQEGTNLSLTHSATAGDYNDAGFLQSGNNSAINISQEATSGHNYAQTWQQSGLGYTGNNNHIDVVQDAGGSNYLKQRQSGQDHIVNLKQTANTDNHAETYQGQWGALEKNNVLYGAVSGTWGPLYVTNGPATQTSANADNYLWLDQNGSNNKVGLSQSGSDYNTATITQDGGDNSLLVFQTNNDGYNSLMSTQTGGANNASVYQSTVTGSGIITVNQN